MVGRPRWRDSLHYFAFGFFGEPVQSAKSGRASYGSRHCHSCDPGVNAPHGTISDVKVYAEAGTYQVADFLEFLSRGPFRVTIDSKTAEDLRHRQIKIKVPSLKDASLQYVLDQVLTPQLPGPEQWTYEVVGKTVMVRRR